MPTLVSYTKHIELPTSEVYASVMYKWQDQLDLLRQKILFELAELYFRPWMDMWGITTYLRREDIEAFYDTFYDSEGNEVSLNDDGLEEARQGWWDTVYPMMRDLLVKDCAFTVRIITMNDGQSKLYFDYRENIHPKKIMKFYEITIGYWHGKPSEYLLWEHGQIVQWDEQTLQTQIMNLIKLGFSIQAIPNKDDQTKILLFISIGKMVQR